MGEKEHIMESIECTVGSSSPTSSKKVKTKKAPSVRLPWPRKSVAGVDKNGKNMPVVDVGIDLKLKRPDIIKLVHKFFHVEGVSMEDLLQEVYVAIAHKNHAPSAHNPNKSSFGHYVYMVANNVCINLVHKSKRYDKERESIDVPQGGEDGRSLLETVAADVPDHNCSLEQMAEFELQMRRAGKWEHARYVTAVRSGASPEVIREALTWGDRKVSSKTIRDIRNQVRDAISEYGIPALNFGDGTSTVPPSTGSPFRIVYPRESPLSIS